MKDWRFWLAEQRGHAARRRHLRRHVRRLHRRTIRPGFTANVVQTASNKGVLLAFVAMAQTLVVLTAGIDLSVGMIFILTNCLASWLVVGTPIETALRRRRACWLSGSLCGALNGADRHLRPAAADRHDDRHRRRSISASRCCCGRFPAARSTRTWPTR